MFYFYINFCYFTLSTLRIMHQSNNEGYGMITNIPMRLQSKIIEYLSTHELYRVLIAISGNQDYLELSQIITIRLITDKYYNVFDRSYYLDMFQHQKYLELENRNYYQLALSSTYSQIKEFPKQFQNLLFYATSCVPQHIRPEFSLILRKMIIDPEIAMPRLHRECVGLSVNSNFQSFLLSVKDQDCNDYAHNMLDQPLETFKETIESNEQDILRQMMKSTNQSRLKDLRLSPHKINKHNFQDLFIKNCQLSNLIVFIFGLIDLYLENTKSYLSCITDQTELLMELTIRYLQFQNTTISIQENLGFVFDTYNELYEELYGQQQTKFTYHSCAMNKWKIKMSGFHEITHRVYSQLYVNQLNKKQYSNQMNRYLNGVEQSEGQISELLVNSSYDMETLNSLYLEYSVDLSVNENNIMFCEHSQQTFGEPYQNLQTSIFEQEIKVMQGLYYNYHKKIISDEQVCEFLKERTLHYEVNLKMCSIRKLGNYYGDICRKFDKRTLQFTEKDKLIERAYAMYPIKSQFSVSKKIDHNCELDEETAQSSSSENQSIHEYVSDDEDQMEEEIQILTN